MMKSSTELKPQVFFRIKPAVDGINGEYLHLSKDKHTIFVRKLQELSSKESVSKQITYHEFQCNYVFTLQSQEQIYNTVGANIVEQLFNGSNSIVLSYGQTGSGKSLTTSGLFKTYKDRGLIPRFLKDIFQKINMMPKSMKAEVQIVYIELFNDILYDLLIDLPNNIPKNAWKSITKLKVRNEMEALELLYKGEGKKEFANDDFHKNSHLGSSIFTIYVTTKDADLSQPYALISKLHVIDLAGIDTVGNTSCSDKKPIDIGQANLVKTFMDQFFHVLYQKNPVSIRIKQKIHPFINFLGDDLSRKSTLRFIGHIIPSKSRANLSITISILKFGQIISGLTFLKMTALHDEDDAKTQIMFLKNKLEEIKRKEYLDSMLLNQNLSNNITSDRCQHIERTIQDYLNDKINHVAVISVADVEIAFKTLKNICVNYQKEKADLEERLKTTRSSQVRRKSSIDSKKAFKNSKGSKDSRDSIKTISEKSSNLKPISEKSLSKKALTKATNKDRPKISNSKSGNMLVNEKSQTKESFKPINEKSPKTSANQSESKKKSGSVTGRGSTSALTSKRKSSYSLMTDLEKMNIIPEDFNQLQLPDFKEAWTEFTKSSRKFAQILKEYERNEEELKRVYIPYLERIHAFNDVRKEYEARKARILDIEIFEAAQMESDSTIKNDEREILNKAKRLCEEKVMELEKKIMEEQEEILKHQAELKAHLQFRVDLKEQLYKQFDEYCKEKYKVLIPNIDKSDILTQESAKLFEVKEIQHDTNPIEDDKIAENDSKLKKLMLAERNKKLEYRRILKKNKFVFY